MNKALIIILGGGDQIISIIREIINTIDKKSVILETIPQIKEVEIGPTIETTIERAKEILQQIGEEKEERERNIKEFEEIGEVIRNNE